METTNPTVQAQQLLGQDPLKVASTAEKPKPYRVVTRKLISHQSQESEDPYIHKWGPSPYRKTENSRVSIAHNHDHKNSLPAKAELVAFGARLNNLLLLIQCSHAQIEKKQRSSSTITTSRQEDQDKPPM